jgi:16S rRNA (cytosine967-C5)-methyltransferase
MSQRTQTVDARTAAALAIADAIGGRRFAHDALGELRNDERLTGRDAALASEIALGAVRHVVTIEHVLGRLATYHPHRTPARVRATLLAAAYQMIWMDRMPIHAAVDEAVERARVLAGGRAPGMVNAILRRVSGAIEARGAEWRRLEPNLVRTSWERATHFRQAVLPDPVEVGESAHLAAATGETAPRFKKLVERFGVTDAEGVAWAAQAVPVLVVHRNPLRLDAEAFRIAVETAARHAADVGDDVAFLAAGEPVMDWPAFRTGRVFVQDLTAHEAAAAVDARPGERVLDLCAAPGGKSIALALAMHDEGAVVACDTSAQRLARVLANISRLELACVRTRLLDQAADDPLAGEAPFDAALVDVPCSNTGVIARRPEARLGLSPRKLAALTTIQARLLRLAASHVRPCGRLIYSTCSIEPDENQAIVYAFLRECGDWQLEFERPTLPAWGSRLADWRDGGYAARLVRR